MIILRKFFDVSFFYLCDPFSAVAAQSLLLFPLCRWYQSYAELCKKILWIIHLIDTTQIRERNHHYSHIKSMFVPNEMRRWNEHKTRMQKACAQISHMICFRLFLGWKLCKFYFLIDVNWMRLQDHWSVNKLLHNLMMFAFAFDCYHQHKNPRNFHFKLKELRASTVPMSTWEQLILCKTSVRHRTGTAKWL